MIQLGLKPGELEARVKVHPCVNLRHAEYQNEIHMDYRKGTTVVKLRKRGNMGYAKKIPMCLNIGDVIIHGGTTPNDRRVR